MSDLDEDKRRLLIAAGIAAIGASAIAEPAASQGAPVGTTDVSANIESIPIKTVHQQNASHWTGLWGELKRDLAIVNAWPKSFNTSYEEGVTDDLNTIRIQETTALTHNPRLVEPLLGELSSLIERCLAYRRESSELELQGVAVGVQKYLAEALNKRDLAFAQIDPSLSTAGVLAANYQKVSKALRSANNQISNAIALQIDPLTAGNNEFAGKQKSRASWVATRAKVVQDVERQALGRHEVPGSAHNFVQRFERLRLLFESDIKSAYRRAFAASAGLENLFGFGKEPPRPLPNPTDKDFLDNLVLWTRDAMRAVAKIGEVELELIRHVRIPQFPYAAHHSVDLTGSFAGLKYVRLRAIGASFYHSEAKAEQTNAALRVVLAKDAPFGPRTVVLLPRVKAYGTSTSSDIVSGALLYNVNPVGSWSLRINDHYDTFTGRHNDMGWIRGLNLEMHIVGVPDPSLETTYWVGQDRI